MEENQIPDKLYFKIGEVSQVTGVEPYVLRYWESEFRIVSPERSRSRQRLYTRKDVELILEIKKLLYEERYTIEGAKKKLLGRQRVQPQQLSMGFQEDLFRSTLKEVKDELKAVRKLLR
ncbi:MAG: MerR family transcriptional regulator [bacterium]